MTGKIAWSSFVGAGLLLVVGLAFVAGALLAFAWHLGEKREDGSHGDEWGFSLAITIGIGLVSLLPLFGAFAVLWPFDWDYLSWHRVDGKVEQMSSRLIAEGKGMSQRFVLVLDGRPYAVDDTRASLVKVGDDVTLACRKEYQYAAESGWACNWGAP